jgi:hypothetical protein
MGVELGNNNILDEISTKVINTHDSSTSFYLTISYQAVRRLFFLNNG